MIFFMNTMLFAFGLSLFTPPPIDEEKKWYVPDRAVSQYGGLIGFLSLGVEYDVNEQYSTSVLGGFVSKEVGGENLWSAAWKNSLNLVNDTQYTPYIGVGLLYSFDDDTFVQLPSQYPGGYYPPTAHYFMLYTGISMQIEKKHSVYLEFSTLDYYLEVKGRDFYGVPWEDVSTWGVGYKFDL